MKKYFLLLFICFKTIDLLGSNASVVCLPGLFTTSQSLKPIRYALTSTGFRVIDWDYPSIKKNFEEHAADLVEVLQEIASCHPGEPIHFVTHSSACLILRAALNLPGCPEEAKIGRAVFFTPPNLGSQLARKFRCTFPINSLLGAKSGRQLMTLRPQDILLCFGPFPKCMDILVLAGTGGSRLLFKEPNDGYVTLDETALELPYYRFVYPISHGAMLRYKPALYSMVNFIAYGPR